MLDNTNISQSGLEAVPARSHKPFDEGSTPSSAISSTTGDVAASEGKCEGRCVARVFGDWLVSDTEYPRRLLRSEREYLRKYNSPIEGQEE